MQSKRLGKRKRKQLSRQLRKQLESKGVVDQISFNLLGTKPLLTGRVLPDGKPEIITVDVRQAVNPLRSLIKRVRNLNGEQVKLFLASLDQTVKASNG